MENRSKEDLARMIARNMAASERAEDRYEPVGGVTDFGEDAYYDDYAPVRTVKKKRPAAQTSKSSGGTKKKSSSKSTGAKSAASKKSSTSTKSKSGSKKAAAAAVKKKKAKKKLRLNGTKVAAICTVIVLAGLGCGLGIFFTGKKNYENKFLPNTYVSEVNVGGMDKARAIEELKKAAVIPENLLVTKKDGTSIAIKLSDIGYVDDTEKMVEQYYSEQNHDKWLSAQFGKEEFTINSAFSYDKDKLEAQLSHKLIDDPKATPPKDAYIAQNDNGSFTVVNEVEGNTIDDKKIALIYEYVENELDNMNFDIAISSLDCYKLPRVNSKELIEDCNKLNNLHNMEITFEFKLGKELIDGKQIMEWTDFDIDSPVSGLQIDREAIRSYVKTLEDKYNTFGKDREFESTNRGTITVPQGDGCYGWWLDEDGMINLIVRTIESGESLDTEPVWYENPDSHYQYTCNPDWLTPTKDFSDTYFDVDLSAQHLWYYEDGKLMMESDFVSGYPSESRNTPAGVYKLWIKERGKTLVGSSDGQSYAS
ncbi:MAG: peptidoglycan binding domain-containing protein, partial [Ruminococcus sp.]|nr:peptidoglycan binding domain-containing protein [Ruminococcus sp.]